MEVPINDHQTGIGSLDGTEQIFVTDNGEIPTKYRIMLTDPRGHEIANAALWFQNAPLGHATRNGLTDTAMLAVLKNRLHAIQNSKFATPANHIALDHVSIALDMLIGQVREEAGLTRPDRPNALPQMAEQEAVAIEEIEKPTRKRRTYKRRKKKKKTTR